MISKAISAYPALAYERSGDCWKALVNQGVKSAADRLCGRETRPKKVGLVSAPY